jgi:origin recognition complex subunit 4
MSNSPSKRRTRSDGNLDRAEPDESKNALSSRKKRALPIEEAVEHDEELEVQQSPTRRRTRSMKVEVVISKSPQHNRKALSPSKNKSAPAPLQKPTTPPPPSEDEVDQAAVDALVAEDDEIETSTTLPIPLPEHLHIAIRQQKAAVIRALQRPPIADSCDASRAAALQALGSLLDGTIDRKEGNSCVILGAKGSGKTRVSFLVLYHHQNSDSPLATRRLSATAIRQIHHCQAIWIRSGQ